MYFTINLAFTDCMDMFPNMADSLTLIRDRTLYEQPLPIYLNIPQYDNSLNNRPKKLKYFLNNYINNKDYSEIFDLQQRHTTETHTILPNKNFFFNHIVNFFMFTSSIISIITIMLGIYLFCKHKHIRIIVASLILHKTKRSGSQIKLKFCNNHA